MTDANSNMKNVFMDKIWCNHFSPFVLLLGLLNFYDSQRCNVTFFWLIKIHLASHWILLDVMVFWLSSNFIEPNRLQNISNPILRKYWLNFIRTGKMWMTWEKEVLRESVIAPCNTCCAVFFLVSISWVNECSACKNDKIWGVNEIDKHLFK